MVLGPVDLVTVAGHEAPRPAVVLAGLLVLFAFMARRAQRLARQVRELKKAVGRRE